MDLDRADRELLLRVPGLGIRNVDRILKMRRVRGIRLEDLARLRVSLAKTGPFVLTHDHNPDAKLIDRVDLRARVSPATQLSLDFSSGPEPG